MYHYPMIYIYQGSLKKLYDNPIPSLGDTVNFYIWKSEDRSLGFEQDQDGMGFMRELLSNSKTLLFPNMEFLNSSEKLDNYLYRFKGLTFFDNLEVVQKEIDSYNKYLEVVRKNNLLFKFGRTLIELPEAQILKWYVDSEYTSEFVDFTLENNMSYIVWKSSDLGICFFDFNDNKILNRVNEIIDKKGIESNIITDVNQIPFF
jgi:hypothetical protein